MALPSAEAERERGLQRFAEGVDAADRLTEIVIRTGVCDTDEALAAFAKGAARNADDFLLVEQAVAELDTAQTEAADVGKHIERAVRAVAADAVDLGEAVEQDAAAAFKDLAQFLAEFRMIQCNRTGILTGRVCAGVEVFLTRSVRGQIGK